MSNNFLNHVQHIFPGGETYLGGASPSLRHPGYGPALYLNIRVAMCGLTKYTNMYLP